MITSLSLAVAIRKLLSTPCCLGSACKEQALRDKTFDDGAAKLAELLEAAGVIKGKFVIIEAE